jgi:hypothetical protein
MGNPATGISMTRRRGDISQPLKLGDVSFAPVYRSFHIHHYTNTRAVCGIEGICRASAKKSRKSE